MTNITITDGVTTITMPRTKKITVSGEEVANTVTMASGKLVKDVIGTRTVISAEWDYFPAALMTSLVSMLRGGGFFSVSYPDPEGVDRINESFSVNVPAPAVFRFVNGVPMWHGVKLTMRAQGVT